MNCHAQKGAQDRKATCSARRGFSASRRGRLAAESKSDGLTSRFRSARRARRQPPAVRMVAADRSGSTSQAHPERSRTRPGESRANASRRRRGNKGRRLVASIRRACRRGVRSRRSGTPGRFMAKGQRLRSVQIQHRLRTGCSILNPWHWPRRSWSGPALVEKRGGPAVAQETRGCIRRRPRRFPIRPFASVQSPRSSSLHG